MTYASFQVCAKHSEERGGERGEMGDRVRMRERECGSEGARDGGAAKQARSVRAITSRTKGRSVSRSRVASTGAASALSSVLMSLFCFSACRSSKALAARRICARIAHHTARTAASTGSGAPQRWYKVHRLTHARTALRRGGLRRCEETVSLGRGRRCVAAQWLHRRRGTHAQHASTVIVPRGVPPRRCPCAQKKKL